MDGRGATIRGWLNGITVATAFVMLAGCETLPTSGLSEVVTAVSNSDASVPPAFHPPELAETLERVLKKSRWTRMPGGQLLTATADAEVRGPTFDPPYVWRLTLAQDGPAPVATLREEEAAAAVPVSTEWDWMCVGHGHVPAGTNGTLVRDALRYLAGQGTGTGATAAALYWRLFPPESFPDGYVTDAEQGRTSAENCTSRSVEKLILQLDQTEDPAEQLTVAQRAALAEAWGSMLSQLPGNPEERLAAAGRVLEHPGLPVDIRGALFRTVARRIPPPQIPGLPAALSETGEGQSELRKGALEACLVYAVRHPGLPVSWPTTLMQAQFDPQPEHRQLFGRWVAATEPADGVAMLRSQRLDEDLTTQIEAVVSLSWLRQPAAREELRKAAGHESDMIRTVAVKGLARQREGDLTAYLDDRSPRVRSAVLAELDRDPSLPSLLALRKALADRSPEVQTVALETISRMPVELSSPLLLHSLRVSTLAVRRKALPQLRQQLGFEPLFPVDGRLAEREDAVMRLVREHGLSSELWAAISQTGLVQRDSGAEAAGHRQEVQTTIEEFLALTNPSTASADLNERMEQVGTVGAVIAESLLTGRTDPAAMAIRQDWLPRWDSTYAALGRLQSPDVTIRRQALRELQLAAEKRTLSTQILQQLQLLLVREQDRAMWQVGMQIIVADPRPEAAQIALLAVHHTWPDVRQLGLRYVARHPTPETGLWLLPLLHDPQPEIRLEAVRLAGFCQHPVLVQGIDGQPGLQALLSTPNLQLQRAVIVSLAQLNQDVAIEELLRRCQHPDPAYRKDAVLAMGAVGHRRFVEPLVNLAWTESDRDVRRAALKTLQDIVPQEDLPSEILSATSELEQVQAWGRWVALARTREQCDNPPSAGTDSVDLTEKDPAVP